MVGWRRAGWFFNAFAMPIAERIHGIDWYGFAHLP
jgi:hypothetical protein